MTSAEPERLQITVEILDQLAAKAAQTFNETEMKYLRNIFATLTWLTRALQKSRISVKKIRDAFFGPKSEKTKDVLDGKKDPTGAQGESDTVPASGESQAAEGEGSAKSEEKEKPKGHGRNGAADYTGAKQVHVCSDKLKPGDICPECGKGKVYVLPTPAVIVNVTGQPPLDATVYSLQRLRCNLCGVIFVPDPPAEAKDKKYDEKSISTIALLKYGTGLPFNRIKDMQDSYGIPLPASTQWDKVSAAASMLQVVHDELVRQAAQADVIHNDDTTMRILALMGPIKNLEVATTRPSGRTGTFTTGIYSVGEHRIALFLTGWRHAGENLAQVLARRSTELEPAIQMCDALSRNTTAEFKTIVANCLAHARREFVPLAESFPDEVRYVLETVGAVYKIDAKTMAEHLSADDRLARHKAESGPLMKAFEKWLKEQTDEKKVEPNSALGDAIAYMKNHWQELTLFLRKAGAPLDNNVCERALKRVILHRKNAYFYRTENGARVGDLYMSLIYTARLEGASPVAYLTALQEYAKKVALEPARWMPWCYESTLAEYAAKLQRTPESA